MRIAIFLALSCVAVASAGVVNVTRCGGMGTHRETRVSDCEGYCQVQPGQVYRVEQDFIPYGSGSGSLRLKVNICLHDGTCVEIINADLITVAPGPHYTVRYSLIPNDVVSGQTVQLRAEIANPNNGVVEICVSCDIDVL
ncbi:uncharacterized protein LOC110862982 isoform X1 [Folsomia candida]|uniref:Uncharacterized protein n=1 Tax=Folsomia candida TaxID=158441 RepID=A0A226CVH5_FOLCA|nr:uncharacterized protein LOC110855658 isoform X1 [Folsomia candida]XP_021967876.1 uncharacterized protein LOC110862982 isoform X1 [Folsomia candida]OXA36507.1 hypothetical protein Fcan01_28728 [Folsomia candida]